MGSTPEEHRFDIRYLVCARPKVLKLKPSISQLFDAKLCYFSLFYPGVWKVDEEFRCVCSLLHINTGRPRGSTQPIRLARALEWKVVVWEVAVHSACYDGGGDTCFRINTEFFFSFLFRELGSGTSDDDWEFRMTWDAKHPKVPENRLDESLSRPCMSTRQYR